MDSKQFREAAIASIDDIVKYYDTVEERRVVPDVQPGYLRQLLPDGPPQDGEPWADIQKDIESKILPGITHWQSPNFLAWFPSSSSFPAMLGEMYSSAFTGAAFNWICSPVVTELETIVLDWLAKAFNLPEDYLSTGPTQGGGVIHGTASEAIATVMVAARDKYLREATEHIVDEEAREDAIAIRRSKLVALGSAATHSATKKAAQIAGVRYRSIPVHAEHSYKLTGDEVRSTIEALRAKGLEPFYLTVTLGTTDTCAIDDMDSIADVLAELAPPKTAENRSNLGGDKGEIWVHVDAAYAGVALICPEFQHLTSAFNRFHSFNTNLHKWLLVNFDCSLLFVRERKHLIDALSVSLAILRNTHSDSGLVTDYRDWQIPFGRRFRSLKVWFVLRTYGISGLQAHVRKHIGLSESFAEGMKKRSDLFEIVTGPRFALTTFKVKNSRGTVAETADVAAATAAQNTLTKTVYDAILADGRIFLSSTVVGDVFCIRHCPATPFVEQKHVNSHVDIITEVAEQTIKALTP
ncbi:pyridoxal-dependent decarboxylase-like protein [Microdochium trichocladiopsis]|uniref:Pyridoxal-dependent decarboxylase-like protein n=1 Tax=Microdochium trichocladiopsis TaxID=1682393 RepID=A0A9P8YBT6_9PEZI|nr:pyridoxal-dependent decarboxylase-like protein [Microdochium trichocladiopsis]KAH7035392.1 pyridoxal-dependent decarboxylase-like protein [Microdochium trichocladiopsis]